MKVYLWIIIAFGLLFRLYNFDKGFSFAHDQDLYSWIAKDIVVNNHNRLVGQVTSVDGVFIGSAYYYLMALFYKLGNMNPMMAVIPVTLIGLFTIWSFYFVVFKHFGKSAGLWAAFIYSMSFGCAVFDRWSVPTQPTMLWSIWFLYVILETFKGNLRVLPLYGFLCGFVWQLHIALLPILPLPILGYLISGNSFETIFNKKNLQVSLLSIFILLLTLLPFFLFEIKHNFSQIRSLAVGFGVDKGGPVGINKFYKVVDATGREFQQRLLYGFKFDNIYLYWLVLIISWLYLGFKSKISLRLSGLLMLWLGLILMAQFTTKRLVSEYYFTNLLPVYILIISVLLVQIRFKLLSILVVFLYLMVNINWLVTKSDVYDSYYYKMQVVALVKADAVFNNYPCIATNFIAGPGVGVGFRYLFWWQKIKLIKPGTEGIPVYNIPIPWQISEKDDPTVFGRFGVIIPPKPLIAIDPIVCDKPENQLDPLLGYVE